MTLDDLFLLLVFLSAVCAVLGVGAYITDTWIPKRRIRRRMGRLTRSAT